MSKLVCIYILCTCQENFPRPKQEDYLNKTKSIDKTDMISEYISDNLYHACASDILLSAILQRTAGFCR